MNERILKLANQAFVVTSEGKLSPLNTLDNVEKFAKLIAQECAEICTYVELSAKLAGDGALSKDSAYWIKKDFGVKE